jgi:hypothetical protein
MFRCCDIVGCDALLRCGFRSDSTGDEVEMCLTEYRAQVFCLRAGLGTHITRI